MGTVIREILPSLNSVRVRTNSVPNPYVVRATIVSSDFLPSIRFDLLRRQGISPPRGYTLCRDERAVVVKVTLLFNEDTSAYVSSLGKIDRPRPSNYLSSLRYVVNNHPSRSLLKSNRRLEVRMGEPHPEFKLLFRSVTEKVGRTEIFLPRQRV